MPQSKRNATINHDRIDAMLRLGFTPVQVARRLGCSARHVRRLARQRGIEVMPNAVIGTERERPVLWRSLPQGGCSYAPLAYLVGRTRQAVTAYFSSDANTPPPAHAE